jgi:hypothetical protein
MAGWLPFPLCEPLGSRLPQPDPANAAPSTANALPASCRVLCLCATIRPARHPGNGARPRLLANMPRGDTSACQ